MTHDIVKRMPGNSGKIADSDRLLKDFPIEPSLFPQPQRLVPRYAKTDWQLAYQRHLERRIQRNPRDLYSHVRRVLTYRALGDNERGFGALVDLFLLLGPRGRQLREHMLDRFEGRLSSQQYRFLCSHLICGLSASEPLPTATRSLLAKGISGTTQIVMRRDEQDEQPHTPLASARQCMANGDAAGAQAVLEAAISEDPGSADVCRALLDLYREQNLRYDFFATYAECLSRGLALPALWEETERYFLQAGPPPNLDVD